MRASGSRNAMWKGGRTIASNGYVLIRVGSDHPLADVRGYAYEHRIVAEQKAGRPLLKGEHVHHINGDKQDNRPENLEVLTAQEHRAEHREPGSSLRTPGEENTEIRCKCGCGRGLTRYDAAGRPREFLRGHNSVGRARAAAKIVAILAGGTLRIRDIAVAYGSTSGAAATALSGAVARGVVVRLGRGLYAIPGMLPEAVPSNAPVACACGCGTMTTPFDSSGRPRRFVSGHNLTGGRNARK